MEKIILVDEHDNAIGTMEKMEAHRRGVLHRAFSIILFNSNGEILLQKRSKSKYHSGGLWTNTCCSHPLPNESIQDATRRRLKQEMGIDLQPEFAFKFIYKTPLDQNLIEHEYDHVFIGTFDGDPCDQQRRSRRMEIHESAFASIRHERISRNVHRLV